MVDSTCASNVLQRDKKTEETGLLVYGLDISLVGAIFLPTAIAPHPSMDEIQAILDQTYALDRDPPLYSSESSWNASSFSLTTQQHQKHRRHVVFGSIVSTSPLSVHTDPTQSHFFVKVKHCTAQTLSWVPSCSVAPGPFNIIRWCGLPTQSWPRS